MADQRVPRRRPPTLIVRTEELLNGLFKRLDNLREELNDSPSKRERKIAKVSEIWYNILLSSVLDGAAVNKMALELEDALQVLTIQEKRVSKRVLAERAELSCVLNVALTILLTLQAGQETFELADGHAKLRRKRVRRPK